MAPLQGKYAVMEETKEFFYDRTQSFINNLDANPNLIGFDNGVYDMVSAKFRKGNPEDNISMSTKIEYHEFDPYDDLVLQVKDFIELRRKYLLYK